MYRDLYNSTISRFPDAPDRFEMSIRSVYEAILSSGDVAIDVGAHTGKHAIPMAKAVGVDGCVYAFEPIAEKCARLIEYSLQTPDVRICAMNACVGEKSGEVSFTYLPDDPGKSAIHVRQKLQGDTGTLKHERVVPMVSLDQCLARSQKVRFIKIDVEGAELSVLQGCSNIISSCAPIIHAEVGESPLSAHGIEAREIYQFFASKDYVVFDIIGTYIPTEEGFLQSIAAGQVYDYFACPAGSVDMVGLSAAAASVWR